MIKKSLIILISSVVAVVSAVVAVLVIISNNVKYTVTFNSDGGTLVEEQIIKKGDRITKPTDPTKKGYKFISWTYQNETYDFSLEVSSDMELKAKWYEIKENIKEYIVKFDTNGGTTIENQIVEEGNKIPKPKEPTKEGYIFKGWYLNDKEYDFETEVTKDIKLDAKWEKINVSENNNSNNNNNTNNTNNNNTSNNNQEETIKVEIPTLTIGGSSGKIEKVALFTIGLEGYYVTEDKINTISGWELYEKVGSKYNLVNGYEVSVDIGECKTYVARAYALNKKNEKIYSAYSNEVKIDNLKVEAPTLTIGGGSGKIEKVALFTIGLEGYYVTEDKINTISGWELYEKVGSEYNLVNGYEVSVDIGECKTYVARTYALNKKNEKVYSAYSNEVKIDNSILYGDVNGDTRVNTTDVIIITKYAHGTEISTEYNINAGDVNLDGVVDDVDASVLAKYIVDAEGFGIKLPYNSENKYQISYNLNSGMHTSYILTYAQVSLPYKLNQPIKEGYAFVGWTGSNGNTPELEVEIPSGTTGNLTYTANWIQYGDVREDGTINSGDLIYIQSYIEGTKELIEKQRIAADVNLDSKIDDKDLDILAKYISGDYGIDKLPYKQ